MFLRSARGDTRVLLGSGEQCKKRAAQDSANLQHSRKLNMFNNCQLIRPTKTALQCLIDQNYSIVVTALTYRIQQAKKLLMKFLVSIERNAVNALCFWNLRLGCLLLAVWCLLPQLCCQVVVARVNRHNLQKPRLLWILSPPKFSRVRPDFGALWDHLRPSFLHR